MIAIEAGQVLPTLHVVLDRTQLVRYAGASGDFNPIHHSDRAARELGLSGVIAHGLLTMGVALRAVTDWCGDPGRIRQYKAKFTRPVVVPDDGAGMALAVTGVVERLEDGVAIVALDVTDADGAVLSGAVVEVRVD